jgi:DNA-binding IclR family transcriptional regulator
VRGLSAAEHMMRILAAMHRLRGAGRMSVAANTVAVEAGLPEPEARYHLDTMERVGLVTRVSGRGKGAMWSLDAGTS